MMIDTSWALRVICTFCKEPGPVESMEPLSGGDWGCPGCVDGYLQRTQ